MPNVSGSSTAQASEAEVRQPRSQSSSRRGKAAMTKLAHRYGVTQTLVRIVLELMEQPMDFLVTHALEVLSELLKSGCQPILQVVDEGAARSHVRQVSKQGMHRLGEATIGFTPPLAGWIAPRFIRRGRQVQDWVIADLLRRIAEDFLD